jgi:hypothetical protein
MTDLQPHAPHILQHDTTILPDAIRSVVQHELCTHTSAPTTVAMEQCLHESLITGINNAVTNILNHDPIITSLLNRFSC